MAGNRKSTGLNVYTVQEATNLISQRKQIVVTPTLTTSAIGTGDVLVNSAEIPNAVLQPGGCSILNNITLVDYDDDEIDIDLIFTQNSATIGTVNAVPDIAVGDIVSANILGIITTDRTDITTMDIGNAKVQIWNNRNVDADTSTQQNNFFPIFLQAAEGSTSVYFSIITQNNTWGASDLEFHFNIEY